MKKNIFSLCFMLLVAVFVISGCQSSVYATKVEIKNSPVTIYYETSTGFDYANAVVTVIYNDGTTKDVNVTADMLSHFDNIVGRHTAYITIENVSAKFEYTVMSVAVAKVEIKNGIVTNYFTSSTGFDYANTIITVTYNDGTIEDMNVTAEMIGNFDNTVGTHTGYITVDNVYATFEYTVVVARATKVEIKNPPVTTYYASAMGFDYANAIVTVTYNDGTAKDMNVTAEMIGSFDNTVGTHTGYITIDNANATFEYTVEVVYATNVVIKNPPVTTYYDSATGFDYANAIITVTYNDGRIEDVNVKAEMLGYFDNIIGRHTGRITVDNVSVTFEYTVVDEYAIKLEINVTGILSYSF